MTAVKPTTPAGRSGLPRATRRHAGFTLVEVMVSLAIFVVLAALVCAGIPVAWRTYTAAVDSSNAQVLLSTTSTLLRDELARASHAKVDASGAVEGYVTGEGYWAELDGAVRGIEKRTYRYHAGENGAVEPEATASSTEQLVTDAAMTDSLSVTFAKLSYDKATGVFSVSDLKVTKGDDLLAEVGTDGHVFKVKAISPEVRDDG